MSEAVVYESEDAWRAEAVKRFGPDPLNWKFVCPSCGHIAAVRDWKAAGASEGAAAFSCVGRYLPNPQPMGTKPGPCDYAGGGLFRLNPVKITGHEQNVFDFAPSATPTP